MIDARGKITLMTFCIAACMTGAVITAWLQDRADENVKPEELYSIVDRQLDDLRAGDYSRAYEYASSDIQRRYDVSQFAAMLQTEYPELTQTSRAQYGEVMAHAGRATMQVYLIEPDGEVMPCVYILVREGDGWRIDGARLSQPWPAEMRSDETVM